MKRITVRLEAPPAHIRVRLKFASSIGEVMTPFTAEHGSIDGAQSAQLQNTGAPSELAEIGLRIARSGPPIPYGDYFIVAAHSSSLSPAGTFFPLSSPSFY